jgi:hypothetical protein
MGEEKAFDERILEKSEGKSMKVFRKWLLAPEARISFVLVEETSLTLHDCSRSVCLEFWADDGYSTNAKIQERKLEESHKKQMKRIKTVKEALEVLECNVIKNRESRLKDIRKGKNAKL